MNETPTEMTRAEWRDWCVAIEAPERKAKAAKELIERNTLLCSWLRNAASDRQQMLRQYEMVRPMTAEQLAKFQNAPTTNFWMELMGGIGAVGSGISK